MTPEEAIALLTHTLSAKRRAGARTLRKLADPAAGPALLEALRRELDDPRTWETQYQLIMALGACRHLPAEPLIRELAGRDFDSKMLYVAIGDALVHLTTPQERMPQTVLELARSGNPGLSYGACQAMGMLRLVPPREIAEELMTLVARTSLDEAAALNGRFWVAVAAPGWLELSPATRPFLQTCAKSKYDQLRLAAESALKGEYGKFSPL
jgi:HEAT repeat protein